MMDTRMMDMRMMNTRMMDTRMMNTRMMDTRTMNTRMMAERRRDRREARAQVSVCGGLGAGLRVIRRMVEAVREGGHMEARVMTPGRHDHAWIRAPLCPITAARRFRPNMARAMKGGDAGAVQAGRARARVVHSRSTGRSVGRRAGRAPRACLRRFFAVA
jgi:hypothetical protein